jgi:ribosomal protein L37E
MPRQRSRNNGKAQANRERRRRFNNEQTLSEWARHILPLGRCASCGKQIFLTRKDAKQAAARAFPGKKRMRVYQCQEAEPRWWHWTTR